MTKETQTRSVLAQVRELVPLRALTPSESRQIIERQATRLLRLADVAGPPVPVEQLAQLLPRVQVVYFSGLPSSGRTQWTGSRWTIVVDSGEAPVRQRFSLGHELAHVIYHPIADTVLPDTARTSAHDRLEQSCEYFSACLLMPRVWVKRAYYEGMHDVPSLARLFDVSWVATQVRLEQLGLTPRTQQQSTRSAA